MAGNFFLMSIIIPTPENKHLVNLEGFRSAHTYKCNHLDFLQIDYADGSSLRMRIDSELTDRILNLIEQNLNEHQQRLA